MQLVHPVLTFGLLVRARFGFWSASPAALPLGRPWSGIAPIMDRDSMRPKHTAVVRESGAALGRSTEKDTTSTAGLELNKRSLGHKRLTHEGVVRRGWQKDGVDGSKLAHSVAHSRCGAGGVLCR